jgi:hypothetical protein
MVVQCAIPTVPPMSGWFFHHPESTSLDDVVFFVAGVGLLLGLITMVVGLIAAGVLTLTKSRGNPP